jgi:hypothetical protein
MKSIEEKEKKEKKERIIKREGYNRSETKQNKTK